MKLLINVQQKSYENAKIRYISKEQFKNKDAKKKKYDPLETIVTRQVLHIAFVI